MGKWIRVETDDDLRVVLRIRKSVHPHLHDFFSGVVERGRASRLILEVLDRAMRDGWLPSPVQTGGRPHTMSTDEPAARKQPPTAVEPPTLVDEAQAQPAVSPEALRAMRQLNRF